jgi:hypothetical protein
MPETLESGVFADEACQKTMKHMISFLLVLPDNPEN